MFYKKIKNFDLSKTKQRFTIKKLSVGVVSVLIGLTFIGTNQNVSADTFETGSQNNDVSIATTSPVVADSDTLKGNSITNYSGISDNNAIPSNSETLNGDSINNNSVISKITPETTDSEKPTVNSVTNNSGVSGPAPATVASSEITNRASDTPSETTPDNNIPNGYTTSQPTPDTTLPVDPVPNRYSYEVVASQNEGQTEKTYYVFSIDTNEKIDENNYVKKYYLTRFRNNNIISTTEIDINKIGLVDKFDDNISLNIVPGTTNQMQLDTGTSFGALNIVYNALSETTTTQDGQATANISTISVAQQKTKYIDEETGQPIHPDFIQNDISGYNYTTKPIEIPGYTYIRSTDNQDGTLSLGQDRSNGSVVYQKATSTVSLDGQSQQVTFYIKREYIDDQQTAKMTVYMTPRVNDGEETDAETFFNNLNNEKISQKLYTNTTDLNKVSNNGLKFSDFSDNDITYYYLLRPRQETSSKYLDWIKQSPEETVNVNEIARFYVPAVDENYLQQGNLHNTLNVTNKFQKSTTVVYYYISKKGSVVVHYVDKAGNVLKNPVTDTDKAPVDTAYDTTDNKPQTLEKDGKKYQLVPNLTQGVENGKVPEGQVDVTYVYEQVGGQVNARYVIEGTETELQDPTEVKPADSPIGEKYTATKPAEIVKDGKTYVVSLPETGIENNHEMNKIVIGGTLLGLGSLIGLKLYKRRH